LCTIFLCILNELSANYIQNKKKNKTNLFFNLSIEKIKTNYRSERNEYYYNTYVNQLRALKKLL